MLFLNNPRMACKTEYGYGSTARTTILIRMRGYSLTVMKTYRPLGRVYILACKGAPDMVLKSCFAAKTESADKATSVNSSSLFHNPEYWGG